MNQCPIKRLRGTLYKDIHPQPKPTALDHTATTMHQSHSSIACRADVTFDSAHDAAQADQLPSGPSPVGHNVHAASHSRGNLQVAALERVSYRNEPEVCQPQASSKAPETEDRFLDRGSTKCKRAFTSTNRTLLAELANQSVLSSLYSVQLAHHPDGLQGHLRECSNGQSPRSDAGDDTQALVDKAIQNYDRGLAVAVQVGETELVVQLAVGLADLHVARRDLPAAAATLDACTAACCGVTDVQLRGSLLQRVLPLSMELLVLQGRTADSFARWRLLNQALAQCGRSVPEECPICAEAFCPDRACLALACGHSFHRDCCDAWLGSRMFQSGTFQAECPVCKQLDPRLKPTPAAVQVLTKRQRRAQEDDLRTDSGVTGSGSGGGVGSAYSCEEDGSGSNSNSNGASLRTGSSGRDGAGQGPDHGSESSSGCESCGGSSERSEGWDHGTGSAAAYRSHEIESDADSGVGLEVYRGSRQLSERSADNGAARPEQQLQSARRR